MQCCTHSAELIPPALVCLAPQRSSVATPEKFRGAELLAVPVDPARPAAKEKAKLAQAKIKPKAKRGHQRRGGTISYQLEPGTTPLHATSTAQLSNICGKLIATAPESHIWP